MAERPTRDAARESRCEVCDGLIEQGERIALLSPGGAWVHQHCAEDEAWEDDRG